MSNTFRNLNNTRNRIDEGDYRMFCILNLINMYNDNNININRLIQQNNNINQTLLTLMNANNSHSRPSRLNNGISYVIDNIAIRHPNTNQSATNNNNHDNIDVDVENILADFLNPVVISPTSQQIEVATRNVRYGNITRPLNESCCFTLETFREDDVVTMIRHCQHIFSRESLQNWFRSNYRCPICRYDIRRYSIDTTSNASNTILTASIPLSTTPSLVTRTPSQLISRGFSRNLANNDAESELSANLINQITDIILARNENGGDTRDISANIV